MTQSADDSLVIRNATIVTMNKQGDVVVGDIVVRGGAIAAIGVGVGDEIEEADRYLDASGLIAIPGFVQPHVHLCQSLFRNLADDLVLMDWLRQRIWPFEGALTERTMAVTADIGLAELIRGGTTTILDMGTVHHTDTIGERVTRAGIRAVIGKAMMDEGARIPDSLQETRQDSVAQSIALSKRWDGAADGRIRYGFAPRFAFSCSRELLEEVGDYATSGEFIIHTHANETTWEASESVKRWGMSNTEYLDKCQLTGPHSIFAHGVHLTDREREILADTGTTITHCPSSNLKLGSGIADVPGLWESGIAVALAADGAPCNNNLDQFVEMRLAALIQKPIHGPTAMEAQRVLQLATIDGARAMGMDDEVGSLEVGKAADIALLDLNQPRHGVGGPEAEALGGSVYAAIVYSASSNDVRHLFCQGRQLVEDGELVGYDTDELQHHGREALRDVADRIS